MKKFRTLFTLILALFLLAAAGCGGGKETKKEEGRVLNIFSWLITSILKSSRNSRKNMTARSTMTSLPIMKNSLPNCRPAAPNMMLSSLRTTWSRP